MRDFAELFQKHLPEMSKGQKRIAEFITENAERAAYLTAARLGEMADVSESTVVRFAFLLGFPGYPEFQKALQTSLKASMTPNQRMKVTNLRVGDGDLIHSVMNGDAERIRATADQLDREAFSQAVDAILKADNIYIHGARSAAALSSFFHFNLNLIFDKVRLLQPTSTGEIFEQMLSISENDVLIAISFPRYSTKIVKAVHYARSQGAYVIALTDSKASPIAPDASCLLTAQSDMVSYADSLVAPLSIINAIIAEISRQKEPEITARFDRMEQLWEEYEVYEKK